MKLSLISLTLAIAGLALTTSAHAQLTFYPDRTSFDIANPGLPVETFDESNSTGGVTNGSVDKSGTDGVFAPGQIKDGIRFDAVGAYPDQFFVNNAYGVAQGDSSVVLTTNWFNNSADLTFYNNNVHAVGIDLFNGRYSITIYGAGNTVLGITSVNAGYATGFFGVSAPSLITAININNPGAYETFDNVAFTPSGIPLPGVPEPGVFVLFASLGLTGVALLRRRRGRIFGRVR